MRRAVILTLFFVLLPLCASAQGRYRPGDVVPEPFLKVYGFQDFFWSSSISESVKTKMEGCSYKAMAGISWDDLRYLQVLHRDADGNAIVGEMVCNSRIAEDLMEIFRSLFMARYPIERMRLVDVYGGDDEASMRDNNTSCFNQRQITAGGMLSRHSFGMAVDINPRYNPYYQVKNGQTIIEPAGSEEFVDREGQSPYQIKKGDLCYRLFRQHGFHWGGDWTRYKDYQHFERSQTSNRYE